MTSPQFEKVGRGGEGKITGKESDKRRGEGNMAGKGGSNAGGEGYIVGQVSDKAGDNGRMIRGNDLSTGSAGDMSENNMTREMGNNVDRQGKMSGGDGNGIGENKTMEDDITGRKSSIGEGEGDREGKKGHIPGGEGNMAGIEGSVEGRKSVLEENNVLDCFNNMSTCLQQHVSSIPCIDLLLDRDTDGPDGEWDIGCKGGGSPLGACSDASDDYNSSDDYDSSNDSVDDSVTAEVFGEHKKFEARNPLRLSSESESTDTITPSNSPRKLMSKSDSNSLVNRQRNLSASTSTITPSNSQDKLDTNGYEQIPRTVPKYLLLGDIKPKLLLSPSSVDYSVGSTLPSEYFSTNLSEDGVCPSRRICSEFHNVQYGSAKDLEDFVQNEVYNAEANAGLLLNTDDGGLLKPHQQDGQSFYREGSEYTVLSCMEHGSSIALCQDTESGVKFIRKERQRAKFQGQKKSVLVPLRHQSSKHIMGIYGVIVMQDVVYTLMEYCEGGSIPHRGAWSISDTSECVQHILESLIYLHGHGLVHGDIKPENICFRVENDVSSLCLIDFEYVRIPEEQPQFKGYTTQYLPPWWAELKNGLDRELLTTMDLWATACIAVCLLTGKKCPWSEVAKTLKKIVKSCELLHKKLRQHIQEQGDHLLGKHLDSALQGKLQTDPTGRALWQTLVFLTGRNAGVNMQGASAALDLLTGERATVAEKKEIERIDVEVVYKKKVLVQIQVNSGTLVGQVLELPDVIAKLKTKFVLWKPKWDHLIICICRIEMQKKRKTDIVSKIKRKISKQFGKDKKS